MTDVELMLVALNTRPVSRFGLAGVASTPQQIRPLMGSPATETKAITRLLVYTQSAGSTGVEEYIHYLGGLLDVPAIKLPMPVEAPVEAIGRDAQSSDLVLFDEPDPLWVEHWLHGRSGCPPLEALPASTLLVRRPCVPLRNILLVMRLDETDEAAAEWTTWLARESGAAVTILPIVPPIPAFYRLNNDMPLGLDGLLSPNTLSGAHLRRLLARLADNHIDGTLRLREGEPGWQLRQEIAQCADNSAGDSAYDLVIIGAECHGRLYRWFMGELVGPLLSWIERPVLIAR